MSTNPPATPADSAGESRQLTAAEVAKKVRRTVIELVDGKDGDKVSKPKRVAVDPAELLSWRDYGTHIVAVTRDGQKLSSLDA